MREFRSVVRIGLGKRSSNLRQIRRRLRRHAKETEGMSEQTATIPRPGISEVENQTGEWIVIVFDNPVNTFEQVISILQKATGCSLEEAEMETWEVHHLGRSIVHHGDQAECERAASIISTIGIAVKVEKL